MLEGKVWGWQEGGRVMAKELVTKERSQRQEGWMKWLKEALADGAARAHLWTKRASPLEARGS